MSLPITKDQAHNVAHWMKSNFGGVIQTAVNGTPFSLVAVPVAVMEIRG